MSTDNRDRREYMRAYHLANAEKRKETSRKWRKAHRDHINAYARAHRSGAAKPLVVVASETPPAERPAALSLREKFFAHRAKLRKINQQEI